MAILSKREDDMVRDLLKGLSAKEIADRNCISTHTVNTHFKSIRRKLRAKNNVDVAVKYLSTLKEPKKYLKQSAIVLLFFGIQGNMIVTNHDYDLRRPRLKTIRSVRTAKTRLQ